MRLFGPFVDVVSADPWPRATECARSERSPPVCETETQPHTFRAPEKQSSLKALGLLLLSCRLCCLEVRMKEGAVGLVRLQKTGPLVFFSELLEHMFPDRRVV